MLAMIGWRNTAPALSAQRAAYEELGGSSKDKYVEITLRRLIQVNPRFMARPLRPTELALFVHTVDVQEKRFKDIIETERIGHSIEICDCHTVPNSSSWDASIGRISRHSQDGCFSHPAPFPNTSLLHDLLD